MRPQRLCSAYHIERSIASRQGFLEYPCACRRCHGARKLWCDTISRHHRLYGRDPFLSYPILTMNGANIQGPIDIPTARTEAYRHQDHGHDDQPGFVWPRRTTLQIDEMVNDTFARADSLHNSPTHSEDHVEDLFSDDDATATFVDEGEMEETIRESTKPIYEGCPMSRLQAGIILLNLCNLYGVSHAFMDELMSFIAGDVLPTSNCFPCSTYDIRRMVMKMGLQYNSIHCCLEGHVLYEGAENEDLTQCPTCRAPRYVDGSNNVLVKVVQYFPIIPRLQRMFRFPEVAKLLRWHSSNHSVNGLMQSVVDGEQWAAVKEIDPEFATEDRNVYMGLVSNGVNPYRNQNVKHSTWPLLMVIYNLPPWLATRKFFILLTMIIPASTRI